MKGDQDRGHLGFYLRLFVAAVAVGLAYLVGPEDYGQQRSVDPFLDCGILV